MASLPSFSPIPGFLSSLSPTLPHRRPRHLISPPSRATPPKISMTSLPTQERVLRLERALAAAVSQERYTDAATLRDALQAVRTADPVLAKRAQLQSAVQGEDFLAAARLRDELAALTERFSRADAGRRVDRIIVLRGRGDSQNALRVATVSREGDLQLSLVPDELHTKSTSPRVYLQPTWSPSGDFVAMTEISFNIDFQRLGRGLAIADSCSRIIIMSSFDGSVVKSAPLLKPPFFYFWSPDGRCVTLLSNDPTASVTTVALSVMQVVAPPGAVGLDLDTVTGPLASGHPFLFDFCPRDSSRVVAHMGDTSTVAIVPISSHSRTHKYLTQQAGLFGSPQWHPIVGSGGREVVLFVEQDHTNSSPKETDQENVSEGKTRSGKELNIDGNKSKNSSDGDNSSLPFEKFLSNGSTLLETVLRKGAESLGLTTKPEESDNISSESSTSPESVDSTNSGDAFKSKFRRLLPKRPQVIRDEHWGDVMVSDQGKNRLVMVDVDNPELKKTIIRFSGIMAFKLSPDGKALATLITNPSTAQDELTVCVGNFSPDSVASTANESVLDHSPRGNSNGKVDILLSTPYTRVLAFFWSPNARRLLFLNSIRGSKAGAAQWATFDLDSNRVVRYEKFVISGIYMHCLNFFDQFASSMTPWSPDSDAFCYPGRPLTASELERDQDQSTSEAPALSALFMHREGASDDKQFSARLQKVPETLEGNREPEEPVTIVDNVEYACWSPC